MVVTGRTTPVQLYQRSKTRTTPNNIFFIIMLVNPMAGVVLNLVRKLPGRSALKMQSQACDMTDNAV